MIRWLILAAAVFIQAEKFGELLPGIHVACVEDFVQKTAI